MQEQCLRDAQGQLLWLSRCCLRGGHRGAQAPAQMEGKDWAPFPMESGVQGWSMGEPRWGLAEGLTEGTVLSVLPWS